MATHKSALKRTRQDIKKRLQNKSIKSHLKTKIKSVRLALEEKSSEKAREALSKALPVIAKAASQRVIHKRTAARKISRLSRQVNDLKS